MISRTIGERLHKARKRAGMTQEQLARRCRVTRSAISQWETGAVEGIEAMNLSAAARALGVTVDYLLTGKEANSVNEDSPDYARLPSELSPLWSGLTKAQQADLIERARSLADLNASIIKELSSR